MSVTERWRILIVEDDPEIQYLLSVILAEDDREIVVVDTGAAAESALAEGTFDLIVLDLILPDVDGRSVLSRLRARPETGGLPVVVLSARGGTDVRQDCYDLGADHFTEKPFDPEEVASDIAARLERAQTRDRPTGIDDPTGLLNRAGLLSHTESVHGAYGLALVQLDGFMTISEKWGWDDAEEVLKATADVIEESAGETAKAARLGGGEFVLFVEGGSTADVATMCEAVLESIRNLPIEDPEGETYRLTASIGVVDAEPETPLDDALDGARTRLVRAHKSGRNQVVTSETPLDASKLRILVAEDDEISATILLHRLRKEGLDVVRFSNGREAYEGALDETPNLVILDVKMPGMDGFEVLERLRRTPSYSEVPIIMLTSMGSEADVVRGFQLGADDYMLKPFSPVELSARVWRLLRRGRSESAI